MMDATHGPVPDFHFREPCWLDETDSTNSELKRRLLRSPAPPAGTVVAARFQSGGRGRMGNVWYAGRNSCLMFSFLWRGAVPLAGAGSLPMACCLGVADFLLRHGIRAKCKWPNDVLVGDAKIAGILSEASPARDGGVALTVGIGVNLLDDPERDSRLGAGAASMESVSGERHDPVDALPALLDCLAGRINAWSAGGFGAIKGDFLARLHGMGARIRVRTPSGPVHGRIADVGDGGELRLVGDDGDIVVVNSAAALEPGCRP